MKFGILAVDYDGTIAKDGVLDPDVRTAIEELRATGIAVILVTGRILDQLRGLIGDLRAGIRRGSRLVIPPEFKDVLQHAFP